MIVPRTPTALASLALGGATLAAMMNRPGLAALGVGAVVTIVWLATLDGWRRLYAILMFLTVCGASDLSALSGTAYYPRYVAAVALAWWTWHGRPDQSLVLPTRASRRLSGALWTLTAIALASIAWSITRITTAQQVIALICLAALVQCLVRYRWAERPEQIIGDFSVAYVVLSVSFVACVVAGPLGVPGAHVYGGRLEGIYSNPNTLGDLVGLAVPLGIGLFISTRRPVYLIGLIPATIALAECQTRTAVVALVAGVTWLWIRRSPTIALNRAIGLVFAAVVVSVATTHVHVRAARLFGGITLRFATNTPGGLLSSRTVAWGDAFTLWKRRPVQGYGFQAGDRLFSQLYDGGVITFTAAPTHNSYLQALLELGVLGALPLGVILVATVLPILFRARVAHPASPFVGVVVAGLAIQLTESAMFGTGQPYPWVFWPAMAALSCAVAPRHPTRVPAPKIVASVPARVRVAAT